MGIILVMSINYTALAATDNTQIVSPRWIYVSDISGFLTVNGTSGDISISISGNSNVTKITATATLYYKNVNNAWVKTNTSWDYTTYSKSLFINETFAANSGVEYKVVFEANVYVNNSVETVTREFT